MSTVETVPTDPTTDATNSEPPGPAPRIKHGMLLLSRRRWWLYGTETPSSGDLLAEGAWDAQPGRLAELVANAVELRGRTPIVVALESDLCLSTSFPAPATRRLKRRSAMAYQVEDSLPVAAEEVATDFILSKHAVLAVCCDRKWLEALASELTAQQLPPVAVCPAPLLAYSDHLLSGPPTGDHLVAWRRGTPTAAAAADLIAHALGGPIRWESAPIGENGLAATLRLESLTDSSVQEIVTYGDLGIEESIRGNHHADEASSDLAIASALRASARVHSGAEQPPLDLLHGLGSEQAKPKSALGREQTLLQVAVLLLLASLAAFGWRSADAALAARDRATSGQADAYRQVFPDKRVPVGVRSRMASELRRLKGVQGADGALPEPVSAIAVVQQALSALPEAMRLRVLEIYVEGDRLYLEGQVRSHGDADRIAAALRRQGFEVAPPSTQQLPERGVDFRLTANWRPGGGPAA